MKTRGLLITLLLTALAVVACSSDESRTSSFQPTLPHTPTPVGESETASEVLTPTPSPTVTLVPEVSSPTPSPTIVSPPDSNDDSGELTSEESDLDARYGIILHTKKAEEQEWFLSTLGTQWFIDYTSNGTLVPEGHDKVLYVDPPSALSMEEVRSLAQAAPGAVWYIMGEPNRRAGFEVVQVIEELHDLYQVIREADPRARITSPSVLNWDFTCGGCGGFTSGHEWVDEFRIEYLARYGEEPPIDIWAIDAYPIDWNSLPTVNSQLVIDQIMGMRSYLDGIPEQRDKPIWITEFGLHWGWDDWLFGVEGCVAPTPAGTYQTDAVLGYLTTAFDWLDANAESQGIGKWFTFVSYADITRCRDDAFAGLTLFDGSKPGAELTEVGTFFKDRLRSGDD